MDGPRWSLIVARFCFVPFNNYVDKKRGEGSKMSVFAQTLGIKTVHAGGGKGSKNGNILST